MESNEDRKLLTWSVIGDLTKVEVYEGEVQSASVEYAYYNESTGQLRSRTINSTTTITYHWNGYYLSLVEENGDAKYAYFNQPFYLGGQTSRITLGANHELDASDEVHYFHNDEAGNVIMISNATGEIITRFNQDIWGNELNGTFENDYEINLHHNGKLYDAIAGVYYNQARWYDPTIGRFISESPISPLAEEEYVYCANDPVNYVDINGENPYTILRIAWKLYDAGSTLSDAYELLETLLDPCKSGTEKALAVAYFAADFAIDIKLLQDILGNIPGVKRIFSGIKGGKGPDFDLPIGPGKKLGNIKKLEDRYLKNLGIDPENFKTSYLGQKTAGRYNISVDNETGLVVLTPVNKGSGESVFTEYTLEELKKLYPNE